jgi:hypothetical protein
MTPSRAVLLAFVALTAVASRAEDAAPAPDAVALVFRWPATLAADVEYRRTRDVTGAATPVSGAPGAATFRGRLALEASGDALRVGYRDWSGPDRQDVALWAAAGKVVQVVDRGGALLRVDTDAAVKTLRALPPLAKDAQALSLATRWIENAARDTWLALVGNWAGRELELGEEYEAVSETPVAAVPGESLRSHVRVAARVRRACPGAPEARCVELSMSASPDGQDLLRVTRALVAKLGAARSAAAIGEMSATTDIVLVTEPDGLVPHRLELTRTVDVAPGAAAPAGASPRRQVDTAVWTYSYAPTPPSPPAASRSAGAGR